MPGQLSAVEAISAALARTKRMLFQPFRFGFWARLAVVALITGEAGGSGGAGRLPNLANLGRESGEDKWRVLARLFSEPAWEQIQPYLFWIVLCFVGVLALLVLWIYSDCIYRFILLDAVVTGQCRLREGWRTWRESGRQYFLWVLAFGLTSLLLLGIVGGVPVWLAWRAGWFQKAEDHIAGLILGGVALGLLLLVLFLALAVTDMLARDFVIPVMAFENVDAVEGWRRLFAMMRVDKSAYVVYTLLKVALSVARAIVFAIADLFVVLILLIPLGLLGVIGYLIGKSLGADWSNISAILLLSGLGLLAFAGILYVIGFVYAPGLVFFQSYTLEFFAARYGPLRSKMVSFAAARPPAAPPVGPPTPPVTPPLIPGDAFPV